MADLWDWALEKIAGTGPSKKRNVERCRKELAASCSQWENRVCREPPTPSTTPFSDAHIKQNVKTPKGKPAMIQIGRARTLTEFAHNPNLAEPPSLDYREDNILKRSRKLREKNGGDKKGKSPAQIEPLDNYTTNDFGTNFVVDDPDIKKVALKTLSACNVRDSVRKYAHKTEELHCIRVQAWERHINGLDSTQSSPANVNALFIPENDCIIQHGFDWMWKDAGFKSRFDKQGQAKQKQRADSGCETDLPKLKNASAQVVDTPANDTTTPKVPPQFRKRDISRARTTSTLSSVIGSMKSTKSCPVQFSSQGSRYQAFTSEQRRPSDSVFFSNSASSNAIASDSDASSILSASTLVEHLPVNPTETTQQETIQQVVAEPTPPTSNTPVLDNQPKNVVQTQQWINTPRPSPLQNRTQLQDRIPAQNKFLA